MTMCVALLIASEFMPASLLTPIAADLDTTQGIAGQAISMCIATAAGRFDRRHVLAVLTALMLASLVLIAAAPSLTILMGARVFLGIAVGGFWALATATIMRLVPRHSVPKALAAPIGSYLGGVIGWRGVFGVLVPLALANLAWPRASIPALPAQQAAFMMAAWGALNSAIPVSWSNWLAVGVADEPEGGAGLIVAAIQLAIMLGASFGATPRRIHECAS